MRAFSILPRSAAAVTLLAGLAATLHAAELRPLPELDLGAMDPAVAEQLSEARAAIDELATARAAAPELARAYGHIGKLFLLYEIVEGAHASFASAVALAPETFDYRYYLGTVHQQKSELESAAATFEAALSLDSRNVPTLLRLGRTELELGRTERAAGRFRAALELAPGSAAALYGLGQIDLAEGRPERAVEHFETVLAAQPEAATAHYQLAVAYRALGESERAREHFARQGRTEVRYDDPLMQNLASYARGAGIQIVRATRARARGDLAGAVAGFRAALAADPGNISARLALASTFIQGGRLDDAIAELEEVLRLEPESASGHYNLGTALALRGETQNAAVHLERATELAPGFADAWVNLAGLAGGRGDFARAAELLGRAIELEPGAAELRIQRADALSRDDRHQPALDELESLLDERPGLAEALLARGSIEERRERPRVALAAYLEALELEDAEDEARARAALRAGALLAAGGEHAAALERLELAAELAPDSLDAQLMLARLHGQSRRFDRAADAFTRAVALAPDNAEARFGGSLALVFAGRYGEALALLEESLAALPDSLPLRHLLARLLATCPESEIRDGERALTLAREVVGRELRIEHAETVAMAMAELGRYAEAAGVQRQVIAQAELLGNPALVERLRATLALYEAGEPKRAPWLEGG